MPLSDSPSAEAADSWKVIVEPVEPFLQAVSQGLTRQAEAFDPGIVTFADYALNGHGKHLRPALVALTANAVGKPTDDHVTAAVIIEMVHLATLIHDDIMDEAEIRRGRLTLAANWGNDIAVLFGDCLFANALTLAASFPTPEVCRAVATATNRVCSGEILQTRHRGDFRLSIERYLQILEMKTAELFALSTELSSYLSGCTPEHRRILRDFGLHLGTAYQLYDDCIDLFGSEQAAGKSLGTDLTKGKLTLPVLVLRESASARDRDRLEGLIRHWRAESMRDLEKLLSDYEILPRSIQVVQQRLDQARQSARTLPSEGRAGLLGIVNYLALQTGSLGACT